MQANESVFYKKRLTTLMVAALFLGFLVLGTVVYADEDTNKLGDLESKISEYSSKIVEAQSKQKTLASTIDVLNNQIYLTAAQISKTKEEIAIIRGQIADLAKKIDFLEVNLDAISGILDRRIEETYKRSFYPPLYLILTLTDVSEFVSRFKYLQAIQRSDKETMFAMEEAKINFDNQKLLKEEKQAELLDLEDILLQQNSILASQRIVKEDLLTVTKNDEQRFQQLLSSARSEYEAIQAIISRRGDETEVGPINRGDRIASIISGASCNSSNTHLHFTVVDGSGNTRNPFDLLKSVDHDNCSGGGECSAGDPFNPGGGWDWPVPPKIRFNQGYGTTWAVLNTWVGQIYRFHNGIDITGSSTTVSAVAEGILYRGSYTGSGGCNLRYVRVDHKDSDLDTFYLHINY